MYYMRRFIIILILSLSLAVGARAEGYSVNDIVDVQTENRYRFVVNQDGILSSEAVATLDSLCYSLRHRGIAQVSIVALNDIGYPRDPHEFAMKLFSKWGVGNEERDNGLGILLVKDMHEIRFVTGYGLEGVLPDALCVRIQRQYMLPHFRNEDYSTGMVEGMRAIDQLLTGGELDQGLNDDYEEEVDIVFIMIIITLLIILPLLMVMINERKRLRCPNCGKIGLRSVEKVVIKDTRTERITVERLVCPHCGSEHKRTSHEDKHPGGMGGPMFFGGMGGFGGRGMGGGSFGGGFGGGSFGGGGGGSRW
jgi:uncharacterized protein